MSRALDRSCRQRSLTRVVGAYEYRFRFPNFANCAFKRDAWIFSPLVHFSIGLLSRESNLKRRNFWCSCMDDGCAYRRSVDHVCIRAVVIECTECGRPALTYDRPLCHCSGTRPFRRDWVSFCGTCRVGVISSANKPAPEQRRSSLSMAFESRWPGVPERGRSAVKRGCPEEQPRMDTNSHE